MSKNGNNGKAYLYVLNMFCWSEWSFSCDFFRQFEFYYYYFIILLFICDFSNSEVIFKTKCKADRTAKRSEKS